MSADQIAELQERGWMRSTMEGMWEHPERVGGPVGLPEALRVEFGEAPRARTRTPDAAQARVWSSCRNSSLSRSQSSGRPWNGPGVFW